MRVLLAITAAAALTLASSVPLGAQEWKEVPLAEHTYRGHEGGYRTDTIDIPIKAFAELEYKLKMKAGDALVYSWEVPKMADPEALLSEFHGHTELDSDKRGTVMFYRKGTGSREHGALTAPFDGIHGWYLLNQSKEDIVVRLKVAGFYELVPPEK